MATYAVDLKVLKEDFLHCSICKNRFQVPKLLPCIHSFCQDCLEKYLQRIESEELPCPICRKICDLRETGVKGLQTNFLLVNLGERIDLLERLDSSPATTNSCGSCDSTDVSAYCYECDSKICQKCQSDHKRFPTLRFHSIIPLKEIKQPKYRQGLQNEQRPLCKIHPDENVRFYCKTCSKLVCEECTTVPHPKPDHEIVEASSELDEVKLVLLELLDKSSSTCRSNLQFIKTGKTGSESVERDFNILIQEIKNSYEAMMAAIENQLKFEMGNIITEVSKLKRLKRTNIDDKIKKASTWMAEMENIQETTQKVVAKNNMWEVLTMSHDLIGAFDDLISDADELKWHQSYFRQNMVFSLNKVPSVSLGRCCIECDVVLCDNQGNFILITFERSSSTLLMKILWRHNEYSWGNGHHVPPFKINVTMPMVANVTATVAGDTSIFIGLGRWIVQFHSSSMSFGKPMETSKDENVFITSLMWSHSEDKNPLYLIHSNDKHVKQLNYDKLLSQEDYSHNGHYINIDSLLLNTKFLIPVEKPLLKAICYFANLVCHFRKSYSEQGVVSSEQYDDSIFILSEESGSMPLTYEVEDIRSPFFHRRQLNLFKGRFIGFGLKRFSKSRTHAVTDTFTCYILWDKKYMMTSPSFSSFIITEYDSESKEIIHTWNVSQANAPPAACYKDPLKNQMVVCDIYGNVTVATCLKYERS